MLFLILFYQDFYSSEQLEIFLHELDLQDSHNSE